MIESWHRAKVAFKFKDPHGREVVIQKGQLVDISNRHVAAKLLADGKVVPAHTSSARDLNAADIKPVLDLAPGRNRVVVTMPMSKWYSGGRIHIFQTAHTLARLGNDVIFCANRKPKWWDDYPLCDNLRFTADDWESIADIDLIIADGKNPVARKGLKVSRQRGIPLVVWNFETPNWFEKFCPDLVSNIRYHDTFKDVFRAADLAVANSAESARHLREWIGQDEPQIVVIRPGVNTFQIDVGADLPIQLSGRKFAVISGRADTYKNNPLAIRAVWKLPFQCDLVAVGRTTLDAAETSLHRFHKLPELPDRVKFALMERAALVLAPSRFEGFGMVPGEAAAVGTPSLVFDLPVLREEYGDVLHYVPHGDHEAFKAKAATLLKDPVRVSAEDRQRVVAKIGMDAMKRTVDATPLHHSKSVHISAVMNAFACAKTVGFALEGVYDHVDEILIAYGREQIWNWPEDDTLEVITSFPDPEQKIRVIFPPDGGIVWKGNTEEQCRQKMRRAACRHVRGNFVLILDGDEIWTGLEHFVRALERREISGGCPLGVTFWHDRDHHIVCPDLRRWGKASDLTTFGAIWPHTRIFTWRASYGWKLHVVPMKSNEECVWNPEQNIPTVMALRDKCVLYHLGHALPRDFMEQKKSFYAEIEGQAKEKTAWMNWDGKIGNTPEGIVKRVDWALPDIVTRAFDHIERKAPEADPVEAETGIPADVVAEAKGIV
jgi:glycosyltransferase involved in cell wall biosynthesis